MVTHDDFLVAKGEVSDKGGLGPLLHPLDIQFNRRAGLHELDGLAKEKVVVLYVISIMLLLGDPIMPW